MLRYIWCLPILYLLDSGLGVPENSYAPECILPLDIGPCRSYHRRFYYNAVNETCERFGWGGCDGNANRFKTQEECEEKCSNAKGTNGNRLSCELELDVGNTTCLKEENPRLLQRYYFNYEEKCKKFYYGGCFGNQNNFATLEKCIDICFLRIGYTP